MQKSQDTMIEFSSLIKLVSRASHFYTARSPVASTSDLGSLAEAVGALTLSSSVHQAESLSPVVKSGLLVVLDMNGVLMFRVKSRDRPPQNISLPDFVANQSKCWVRPYFDEFIEYLFKRHTVGLWSSMMRHNVYATAVNLFGSDVLNPEYTFHSEAWYERRTKPSNYTAQKTQKSGLAKRGSSLGPHVSNNRSQGDYREQNSSSSTRAEPGSSSRSSGSRRSIHGGNAPNSGSSSGSHVFGNHKEIRHSFHAKLANQRVFFIYPREACEEDHEGIRSLGLPKHATVKNLNTLWSAQTTYGPESTIVIDDSAYKLRLQADNQIQISEFDLETNSAQLQDDDSLIWSSLYLEHVSNGGVAIGDIREKVKQVSYLEFLKQGKAWLPKTHGASASIGELVGWVRSRPEFVAKFKELEHSVIGSSPKKPELSVAGA